MAELPEGLSEDALKAAWASAGDGPLLIALSGGGDSVSLLHALAASGPRERLIACVIDHGVRAEAANEARLAASFAERAGVRAIVEKLGALKKVSQETLRRARYMRLCAVARAHGGKAIAAGHTRDDQAETLYMRASRNADDADLAGQISRTQPDAAFAARVREERADWRGLAGMAPIAPAPLWPEGLNLTLTRPLLATHRRALRNWLGARGLEWIEDPSNENDAFERVRARRALVESPELADRLADLAALLRPFAAEDDREARAWLKDAVTLEADHVVLRTYGGAGRATRLRAIAALCAAVAGRNPTPDLGRVSALLDELERGQFRGATFSGVRLRPVAGGVRFCRDSGEVHGRRGRPGLRRVTLAAGEVCVWDNRVEITANETVTLAVHHHDTGAPVVLTPEGEEWRLHAAEAQGRIRARWLIEPHISHILFTPL
ncbi:MAG: tRNA lysidine(34) synthetase [Caulobacterales bacterium]